MIEFHLTDVEGAQYRFQLKLEDQILKTTVEFLSKDPVEQKTLDLSTDLSILEIGEQFGIELPYSCRAGACTTCLCKVEQGKDNLNQNLLGEPIIDLMEDEFLSCIGGFQKDLLEGEEKHVVRAIWQNS